ncbi:MAG: acriflavin resistance protein [Spirochaetaceae bacterium]|nr:acriflavin resistance protein [Spirochaetaceae bacterium]|tara:strand:+ start:10595 stop:13789 length:3195 start_codon:yes stop_codon:yes gene_type:complete
MIQIIHFFVRQRLFINLLVVMILLAGTRTILNMNREAFPNVNFDRVSITTIYPGASPDEIEQLVSIPIEKELRSISGLDKVNSYNLENISVFVLEIDPDASDKKKIIDDIKDGVDATVDDLPANAELPIVEEITFDTQPVVDVALFGGDGDLEDYRKLRQSAQKLEDYLYDIDGVAEVELFGYRDREYLVEVQPEALRRDRIGFNNVIQSIGNRNLNLPGGVIRKGPNEYLLRTKEQYRNAQEIAQTVVQANIGGGALRVGDLATVIDAYEEPDLLERFDAKPAIIMKVWKKQEADMLVLADTLKDQLKIYSDTQLPEGVQLQYFNDQSRFVRTRLSSLLVNGGIGFALLAITLILILGFRMSFIVGMSIPVAFMVAFMGMSVVGITLNVISMFALVMVLGMIVDFSIVVAENGFRYMEEGMSRVEAVETGTAEVFWPVTTTLLCITAAFFPLLYMTGIVGKFVWSIPMVIILCLCASWLAAMFILPSHLETFARVKDVDRMEGSSDQGNNGGSSSGGLFGALTDGYSSFLSFCLHRRYLAVGSLIGVFILSLVLAAAALNFVFFPGGGGEGILVRTRMPQGTNLETNLGALKPLEQLAQETLPPEDLESMQTRVGVELANPTDPAPSEATHRGTLILNLTPVGEREKDAGDMLASLRKATEKARKEGIVHPDLSLDFRVQEGGPPVGMPVNVEIRGDDIETLRKIADEYMTYLRTIDGVFDVSTDLEPGKLEYRFDVNEVKAARSELNVAAIATTIRAAFDGAIATTVNEGEDEIEVRVRFPDRARRGEENLRDVYVSNNKGGLVPLSAVTDWGAPTPGYSMINRLNFRRVGKVQANVEKGTITSAEVNQKLIDKFQDIEKRYPGYTINYGGEEEDRNESLGNLAVLFGFAMFAIYMILASFFRSLILPVVVMSAIPFGLVGVILALLAHGEPLSFMSLLGVVSLAGVVVSNTLVLVQFIINRRKEDSDLHSAVVRAGSMRFRPVLLTSLTTVLGLIPTVYGIGGEDAFVAPLALSFGYGLIFATFITLVLVPCLYLIAEDLKNFGSALLEKFNISLPPAPGE